MPVQASCRLVKENSRLFLIHKLVLYARDCVDITVYISLIFNHLSGWTIESVAFRSSAAAP